MQISWHTPRQCSRLTKAILPSTTAVQRKRIQKMQVMKKLVHAIRCDIYAAELTPLLAESLRAVLRSYFTDASVRIVTSYLAAQLCRTSASEDTTSPSAILQPRPKPLRAATMDTRRMADGEPKATSTLSSAIASADMTGSMPQDTRTALAIFDVLTQMLLERRSHLFRFASAVNTKWLLLFFHPRAERRAAELALQLLVRLLLHPEVGYAQRLSTSGGFKVLERLLPRFWSIPSLFPLLWSALFGIEVVEPIPSLTTLVPTPAKGQVRHILCAPVLRAILSCLKEGMRLAAAKQNGASGRFRLTRAAFRGRSSIALRDLIWQIRTTWTSSRPLPHQARLSDALTRANEASR